MSSPNRTGDAIHPSFRARPGTRTLTSSTNCDRSPTTSAVPWRPWVVAWTMHQKGITAALCGAKRPEQIRDTATAPGNLLRVASCDGNPVSPWRGLPHTSNHKHNDENQYSGEPPMKRILPVFLFFAIAGTVLADGGTIPLPRLLQYAGRPGITPRRRSDFSPFRILPTTRLPAC